MPNRRPRAKFKRPFRNLTTETPDAELYSPETKFLARFERAGWLRLDINLTTGTAVLDLTREIGIKITEATDDLRRRVRAREDEAIRALRPKSAAYIARKLKLPLDRVKGVLYRSPKGVER